MQLLDKLNDPQRRAVISDSKYILALAGAGTGKTTVLTRRIAYLNTEKRVGMTNVLALTFTRLAGNEMKERVISLVGKEEGKKLFCNTFHAFCVKVLKEWGHLLGYDKEFSIYDQEDRESIIKTIVNELTYDKYVKVKKVIDILSGDSEVDCGEEKEVIKEYHYRLKRNNAIDLDMLLTETAKLLKEHQVQQDYHDQYEYVFIDEFQDTNDVQMEIVKALYPKNLFVVGDDFQAIYGWRHAKIDYILNFNKEWSDVEVIKIEENYRCTSPIIKAANDLISYNINQTKKTLKNDKKGAEIELIAAEDVKDEAEKIAFEIANLDGNYKDIAVLARTNKQLQLLQEELTKYDIPNQIINNQGDIFKKHDIKMILKTIEVAINPKDNVALKKIVNFPKQRISSIELEKLELSALDNDVHLADALEKNKETAKLMIALQQLIKDRESHEAVDVFWDAMELLNILDIYTNEGRNNKIQDMHYAKENILRWVERQKLIGEDSSIFTFLKWLVIKDIQEKLTEEKNAVSLMTIHAAKGLEFKNVVVIGMNQGVFPSRRSEDIEEERRLFYVAITRAKDRLILTRPQKVATWGGKIDEAAESQFIKEMGLV